MNFRKRTLTIHVEQPLVDDGLLSTICDMMEPEYSRPFVSVDLIGSGGEPIRRIVFAGLAPLDHRFDLDYASGKVATHILEFTYEGVDALEMVRSEGEQKVEQAN